MFRLDFVGIALVLAESGFFREPNFFSNILWKMDSLNVLERKKQTRRCRSR
jgi:hypothetical protein